MPIALVPLIFGYFQHRHWKQHQIRTWRNDVHIWSARLVIVLGIIDGCLPNIGLTYYFGISALLVLVIYIVVMIRYECKRWRERKSTGRTEVRDGIELEAGGKGTGIVEVVN